MKRKLLLTMVSLAVLGGSIAHTAQAHIINPIHKPLSKMTLKEQYRYYKANVFHAEFTLQWFKSTQGSWTLDAKRYPSAYTIAQVVIRNHKWLLHDSRMHEKEVWTKLHPASVVETLSSGICGSCWDAVAQCESGGNWSEVTGNGFYWGLQWIPSTWDSRASYFHYPSWYWFIQHRTAPSRSMQITAANGMSLSNWPVCGSRF